MNKFRIGIAGAGIISRDHALSLGRMPNVSQIAFYDFDGSRAEALAAQFEAGVASSLQELIAGCDILWVCTPPFAHREAIEAACAAGRAVFCEKPLGFSHEDCTAIAAAVQASGIPFFMGQSGRYATFFMKMKELVTAGAIGEPRLIWSTRLGHFDPATVPPWRVDDRKSGGLMIEFGVHELDFMGWIGGAWRDVYARSSSLMGHPNFQDTVSAVGALQSGVTMRLDVSGGSPRYLWQRGIEGTAGSLLFDDVNVKEITLNRLGKSPEKIESGDWQDPATGENLSLRDQSIAVLDALDSGSPPPVSLQEGWAAVRAALAVQQSARTGKVVHIAADASA
jgi:myo-inositol 2-dehydrogenase/D-chiro-inositol 1-dehydrogenase